MSTLRIQVNGADREVPEGTTVRSLLDAMGLSGPVAVERNRDIVPRAAHATTRLEAGDVLEVVHFVGGG